jgi:predicted RNase H-like HicB family nuclease
VVIGKMMGKNGRYTIILEEDEDGNIIAEVAGLTGCHSWGKTRQEALKNIREALELYIEVEKDVKPLKFLGVEELNLAG